jgi:hypothetical protein
MKRKIVSFILVLAMSLSVSVPAFAEETKTQPQTQPNQITGDFGILTVDTGVINASGVRLRKTAGLSGTILAILPQGLQVEVGSGSTEADGYTWYYVIAIINGTTYSGYVASNYVTILPPE